LKGESVSFSLIHEYHKESPHARIQNMFLSGISTDKKKVNELLERGVSEIIQKDSLKKKLLFCPFKV